MCGRFTYTFTPKDVEKYYKVDINKADFKPNYNVAPTQKVPVIINENNKLVLETLQWGLIPHWSKDKKIAYKMINARSESVSEKPSFSKAFLTQRCLILADGFFEWKKTLVKIPYYIKLKDRQIFSFAGIYDEWKSPEKEIIKTCSIITVPANKFMQEIHDRMPCILPKDKEKIYLDNRQHTDIIKKLLKPIDSDEMTSYKVSDTVNSPRNNSIECIKVLS